MSSPARRYLGLSLLYLFAVGAGSLFKQLGVPLPWMIGPLVLSATVYLSGIATAPVPVQTRPLGQMTVAAQVGLAFSPAALAALLDLGPLLVGTALISALCACVVGIGLSRVAGLRLPQALLATFPTSPVEATVIAEKFGCDPAPIVLSQTVRIASVVVLVPICIYAIDGWPNRDGIAQGGEFDPIGIGLLALLAITGAVLFRKLRLSNPYFLGPLVLSAAVAAAGFQPTGFPPPFLAAAQIVLGTWLGSTFRRELFAEGGRLVVASIASALLLLAIVSACAVGLAAASGQNWEVLVLGAAPGGVTEMALTAKYLGVDLALVTAFQLTRIFLFMPNIPWIIALIDRYETRRGR
ncbi:AbrB family transcriptional regulator [Nitratireductor sp. ZSWI3]|uniref:AbrB family transcriptional regulator n=1 Tax=Nitratireductor sp. ZSWI3 TaxID=2966359 RepID=UPI00215016C1|nr:AbrB family transcriptional regulator [Nitratireductor sp. ZSWI3]MCR4265166.1 AbrB family transcriptional regulator [Nitratireductor sp. ZSWI3]